MAEVFDNANHRISRRISREEFEKQITACIKAGSDLFSRPSRGIFVYDLGEALGHHHVRTDAFEIAEVLTSMVDSGKIGISFVVLPFSANLVDIILTINNK